MLSSFSVYVPVWEKLSQNSMRMRGMKKSQAAVVEILSCFFSDHLLEETQWGLSAEYWMLDFQLAVPAG